MSKEIISASKASQRARKCEAIGSAGACSQATAQSSPCLCSQATTGQRKEDVPDGEEESKLRLV